ncbi:MAG: hypothetical protein M1822_002169 [Bathelium mastoideum]|nr:MAG: hypothetical protein M1822_002169 [Bathelium mastoideum]
MPLLTRSKHDFQAKCSQHYDHAPSSEVQRLQVLYLGIAATEIEHGEVEIGFCVHDGTYNTDFAVHVVQHHHDRDRTQVVADYIIASIREYEKQHLHKYAGAGITERTMQISPTLPSRLWAELDIVPMVFAQVLAYQEGFTDKLGLDEQADAMARKCIAYFGPSLQPRVQVGSKNEVEVDCGGHAQLTSLDQYKEDVSDKTWSATLNYAQNLKERDIKIAFFSSTPQGGGVALMRHALIRFLKLLGIKVKWFVPRPKPEIFRITKTNHNILQGVAEPHERLTSAQAHTINEWVEQNAKRLWIPNGGPLAPRSLGGADFVILDDPQMPNLVKIAKEQDPHWPVLWRSHIQVRSDLIDQKDTPTAQVWQWIYDSIQHADVFISHPVRAFVPSSLDLAKVGFMPASTDWLDGLNKSLYNWDALYYLHDIINTEAHRRNLPQLQYPARPYIVQIARFDPSKSIPDVLTAYARYRRHYTTSELRQQTPQLVIAGHGSVDDPDATHVLDETLAALRQDYQDVTDNVIVLRLQPTDQLLGTLLARATIALQLSTREGFEVKVSEAAHHGVPIIATRAGGIPLQVWEGKSGFLVEPGDTEAVARYLEYT